MKLTRALILGAFVAFSASLAVGEAATPVSAPTPYPKQDADWPGVGPIRRFEWMPQHRAKFWEDRKADQGSVVFVGDSQTEGWETLVRDFKPLRVSNRAIGGEVSRGLLFRFEEDVLQVHPSAIVILIGTNDLTASQPATESIANIRAMLDLWRAQSPKTPILLNTVPPSDSRAAPIDVQQLNALNAQLRALANNYPNLSVVDLYAATADASGKPIKTYFNADKLHLSAAGHARWKQLLLPAMRRAGLAP